MSHNQILTLLAGIVLLLTGALAPAQSPYPTRVHPGIPAPSPVRPAGRLPWGTPETGFPTPAGSWGSRSLRGTGPDGALGSEVPIFPGGPRVFDPSPMVQPGGFPGPDGIPYPHSPTAEDLLNKVRQDALGNQLPPNGQGFVLPPTSPPQIDFQHLDPKLVIPPSPPPKLDIPDYSWIGYLRYLPYLLVPLAGAGAVFRGTKTKDS